MDKPQDVVQCPAAFRREIVPERIDKIQRQDVPKYVFFLSELIEVLNRLIVAAMKELSVNPLVDNCAVLTDADRNLLAIQE